MLTKILISTKPFGTLHLIIGSVLFFEQTHRYFDVFLVVYFEERISMRKWDDKIDELVSHIFSSAGSGFFLVFPLSSSTRSKITYVSDVKSNIK